MPQLYGRISGLSEGLPCWPRHGAWGPVNNRNLGAVVHGSAPRPGSESTFVYTRTSGDGRGYSASFSAETFTTTQRPSAARDVKAEQPPAPKATNGKEPAKA